MITFFCFTLTTPDCKVYDNNGKQDYRPVHFKFAKPAIFADLVVGIAILVIGQLSLQTSTYYLLTGVGAAYTGTALLPPIARLKITYFTQRCILYHGQYFKEYMQAVNDKNSQQATVVK